MTDIYTVEIDGQQYDIEGDRPPNEAEARAAVAAHGSGSAALPAESSAWERFKAPIAQAAHGLASLPGAMVEGAKMIGQGRYGEMANNVGRALVEPQIEQAKQAMNADDDISAAGHGLAAVLPIAGPAAADIGEAIGEGNFAGAAGQSAVLAAPSLRAPEFAAGLERLMRNRAATRMMGVMRPALKRVATAEKIAPEVVGGVVGREAAGGLGVGTRAKLAMRATNRAATAGQDIEAMQSLTQRIDPSPVAAKLRLEAAKRETVAPSGQTFTKDPQRVSALRAQADSVDEMASAFGGDVPAGELFKQRAVIGERLGSKAYEKMPGDLTAADAAAGKAFKKHTSDLLHQEIPGSAIPDHEYHVWKNAATNLENSRLRDMLGRDGKQIMNLLAGRLAGAAIGGASGYATGGGHMMGIAGAALGVTLGESAYWGSLRAATYDSIANALRAGDVDGAATIIQRSAAAYATDKAIRERERNRKAHAALKSQAEGVVGP